MSSMLRIILSYNLSTSSSLPDLPCSWLSNNFLILAILSQYPAIDITRQYKRLVLKRWINDNLFAFLLQYICLTVTTLSPFPSGVWFASGTACALVFLRGYRVVWGIGLGCLFAYYLASHQFILSCASSFIFIIQTILLVWLTRRYINPSLVFYKKKPFWFFVICSFIITGLASLSLLLLGERSFLLLPEWWLANLNGLLTIAIAWITTDTFYTYGGKSFGFHHRWCKVSRGSFVLAFCLNSMLYLSLPFFSISETTIIILQLMLCLGTLIGLHIAL